MVCYSSLRLYLLVIVGCVMRSAILALFFCAGTAAFCQTSAQAPFNLGRHGQNPPAAKPSIDLDKPFSAGPIKPFTPLEIFALPAKVTARWSEDARINPKMIVHPPQASIGFQTPGIPVGQNEFSNLQMLPIDSAGVKIQAIPAQWLSLKVQAIPIQWPQLEVGPVKSGSSMIPLAPAK